MLPQIRQIQRFVVEEQAEHEDRGKLDGLAKGIGCDDRAEVDDVGCDDKSV